MYKRAKTKTAPHRLLTLRPGRARPALSQAHVSLFSHHIWYRGSRMSHEQISSTDHHRNMEGVRSERLGNGPAFARRPPDRQTLGGSRAAALGLRALAGRAAQVYCTQTPQACAVGGSCRRSAKVEGSDWLLSGEASGLGPGSRAGGLGIDHSSVFATRGLGSPQYEATAASLSERPSHAAS